MDNINTANPSRARGLTSPTESFQLNRYATHEFESTWQMPQEPTAFSNPPLDGCALTGFIQLPVPRLPSSRATSTAGPKRALDFSSYLFIPSLLLYPACQESNPVPRSASHFHIPDRTRNIHVCPWGLYKRPKGLSKRGRGRGTVAREDGHTSHEKIQWS